VTDADRLSAALADRYGIARERGQGGMATVYRDEDLKHHCKVAITVLKPEPVAVVGADRNGCRLSPSTRLAAVPISTPPIPTHDTA